MGKLIDGILLIVHAIGLCAWPLAAAMIVLLTARCLLACLAAAAVLLGTTQDQLFYIQQILVAVEEIGVEACFVGCKEEVPILAVASVQAGDV